MPDFLSLAHISRLTSRDVRKTTQVNWRTLALFETGAYKTFTTQVSIRITTPTARFPGSSSNKVATEHNGVSLGQESVNSPELYELVQVVPNYPETEAHVRKPTCRPQPSSSAREKEIRHLILRALQAAIFMHSHFPTGEVRRNSNGAKVVSFFSINRRQCKWAAN